jgi:hypothetical protein
VLALEIDSPEDGESFLFLKDGLRGSGQPVANHIDHLGRSRLVCNEETARVRIRHDSHRFIRGDANNNRWLDVGDAIWIVNELYLGGPVAACSDDADSNDDGQLDVSDVVYLLEYLFRAGRSLPAPFPECGIDPTPDDLSCSGPSSGCG